jgi:hypothetical protein
MNRMIVAFFLAQRRFRAAAARAAAAGQRLGRSGAGRDYFADAFTLFLFFFFLVALLRIGPRRRARSVT